MSSGGFLVRPESDGGNKELWDQTWKRLERFLPDLKTELFPPEPEKPAPALIAVTVAPVELSAPQAVTVEKTEKTEKKEEAKSDDID
jgi:brefeldin A-resistance guanine nucleotide exchange factor 1